MNISKFDIAVLFSTSLCVILLSLSAPAFGLTSQNATNASDVPRFNTSADSFDIAGEFPDTPGTPSSGRLVYNTNGPGGDGINNVWVDGEDTSGGTQIVTGNAGNTSDPEVDVTITEWQNGNIYHQESFILSQVGETAQYQNDSWNILLEYDAFETGTADGTKIFTTYEVKQSPDDEGLLSGIPIVGDVADLVASGTFFIGEVIFWFAATVFEVTVTLILAIVNFVTFMIDLIGWLTTTYFDIALNAPGFAGVIVMVPAIMLFAELAKIIAVVISLLPTT
jgi:hypothetical protein